MSEDLKGKVVLVTGASSGIGRATALAFAKKGAKVVIAARRVKDSEETIQKIKEAGGEGTFFKADVSLKSDVENLIQKAVEKYGRIDCAFNNAGTSGERAPLADGSEENWDMVINISLKGIWLCMKYEIQQMQKQGGGVIVNMSSDQGLVAVPGLAPYIAAKHGIIGLTKSAALEYSKAGIRANVICPGLIMTEKLEKAMEAKGAEVLGPIALIPMGRIGKSEEVADAVLWLCSDASSYVTGHSLVIDGGYLVM